VEVSNFLFFNFIEILRPEDYCAAQSDGYSFLFSRNNENVWPANFIKIKKCNLFIFKQMNADILKNSDYYTSRSASKYV
jgi:hypothetical protein